MTFNQWARRHPAAAAELAQVTAEQAADHPHPEAPLDEAYAQQKARFAVAKAGGLSWRNNVGATPAKLETTCPRCMFHYEIQQRPVRYGLANDSAKLNDVIKSSDLIGVMPTRITQDMVGSVIGQFLAIECKRVGWHFTGQGREQAQQAFLSAVLSKGGLAYFSTGAIQL